MCASGAGVAVLHWSSPSRTRESSRRMLPQGGLRQWSDQDQLVAHRDLMTAEQWDRGFQLSCSINRTRVEASKVETSSLVETKGVDIVVGGHEPQLASALHRDRRGDSFDECTPTPTKQWSLDAAIAANSA